MKISFLPTSLFIACLFLSVPTPVLAASSEVLPPPTHTDAPAATPAENSPENQPTLKKELTPPSAKDHVHVYSYRRSDGTIITRYSVRGRVYMIKVQPGHGMPAYYLYDTNGDGHFNRRMPGNYKMLSPPMWVIKRF